jgi:YD repeat-containing protein
MSKVRSLTVVLVISLLLQPIFPLLAMSSSHPVEKSAPVAANEYLARDVVAEAPAAPVMATLPDRPYLPVIYKTGSAMSALAPNAPASVLPAVSASQVITNGEDIVYLVNHEQIGRTRNFSAISPTWSLVTTMTIGPAGTLGLNKLYDFALDPNDPYHKAWAVGDTGIWRTVNLNDGVPTWQRILSTYEITTTIIAQGGRLPTDFPGNNVIKGISHIAGDVSRPGYFFVVVGNHAGCTKPPEGDGCPYDHDPITGKDVHSYVGRTFDYGETWSWVELPNVGNNSPVPGRAFLATIIPNGGPVGLAASQNGEGRIWLGLRDPWQRSYLLYSGDYGGTWQTIWYTQTVGAPRTLYYAQGSLFMIIDPDHGMKTTLIGKSTDGGKTWSFLPKTQEPTPQWWAYRYILQGVPQTDQLLYYSAGTDSFGNNSFQRSFDGAGTFITYTQPFVLDNVSQFAAAPTVWIDNPERILIPRLGVVSATSADRVVVFSVDGGISWQDKTGYWKSQIGGWSGPNNEELVRAFLPSQVARQRDQSLRDLSRRGKETDCALSCAPPVHWVNDPVDTSNGNLSYQVTDLSVASLGGNLTFQRSYASVDSNVSRPLGYGWANNFDSRIIAPAATAHPVTLTLQTGNGSLLQFFRVVSTTSTGTYAPDLGVTAALTRVVAGNIVTYTLVDKLQTTYVFTTSGALLSKRSSLGYLTTFSYTLPNTLTQVTDVGTGRWLKFTYDQGRLKTVFDNSGRTITFTYNITGDLVNLRDTRGLTWTYVYTGSHLLWKVIDPDQRTVVRTDYDAQGRAVAQYDGLNNRTVKLDFGLGSTRILTDARNFTSTDTYVGGTWTGSLDANSTPITRNYDLNFRPVQLADQNGNSTKMLWSPNGHNLERVVDAGGYTTTMRYDNLNNLTQTVDARGYTTTLTYSGNFLTRRVDALGNTWIYTPTSDGRNLLSKMQDARGKITAYGYDGLGQQIAMTDALTNVTRFAYDSLGRLITTTDALGRMTVNVYDNADNLIQVTTNYTTTSAQPNYLNAYNLVTRYGYDGMGRQIAVTDTVGYVTRNDYDGAGRLILTTVNYTTTGGVDPTAYNLTTRYGYDQAGNQIAITDTLNHVTRSYYDNLNRLISTTVNYTDTPSLDPNVFNLTTRYQYDQVGQRTAITDATNVATFFEYDALGRTTATRDMLGNTMRFEYDPLGNRTVMTDANGVVTRYVYDPLSRLTTVTESFTTTLGLDPTRYNVATRYAYDGVGNRTIITDARGYTTTTTYDALSRVLSESNALSHTTRYQYDAVGNRTVMTDAKSQVTRYTYDALDQVLVISYTADATATRFAYDPLGNRTAMTDTTGTTTYLYDALNRPLTITSPITGVVGYRYDALGNRTKMIYPDGKVVTYTYNAANQLSSTIDWSGQTTGYQYDKAGRPITTTLPNSVQSVNAYDTAHRLTRLTHSRSGTTLADYQFALDKLGNRTVATETQRTPIFADGFESGNFLGWSAAITNNGNLAVLGEAALSGTYGLRANLDTNPMYVRDDTPSAESRYSAGFQVLLTESEGSLMAQSAAAALAPPDTSTLIQDILVGRSGANDVFRIQLKAFYQGGLPFNNYYVQAQARRDDGTTVSSGWVLIAAGQVWMIDADWQAASSAGANNGVLTWRLNGAAQASLTNLDNDTLRVDEVRLGPSASSLSGSLSYLTYFTQDYDTFVSSVNRATTINYTYDPLYRLTNANYSGAYTSTFAYAYDKVGNRTTQTATITSTLVTTYQYDAANRLTNAAGVTYTWDNNGNLINDGSSIYRYDSANRLISTTLNSTTSLFNYNGDGVRLKQIVAGVMTTYTQDLAASLPVVLQAKTGVTSTCGPTTHPWHNTAKIGMASLSVGTDNASVALLSVQTD